MANEFKKQTLRILNIIQPQVEKYNVYSVRVDYNCVNLQMVINSNLLSYLKKHRWNTVVSTSGYVECTKHIGGTLVRFLMTD